MRNCLAFVVLLAPACGEDGGGAEVEPPFALEVMALEVDEEISLPGLRDAENPF